MLDVKTWEPVTYRVGSTHLQFKVRRLNFTAAKVFRLTVMRCGYDDLLRSLQRQRKAQAAIAKRAIELLRAALASREIVVPEIWTKDDDDEILTLLTDLFRANGLEVPSFDPAEEATLLDAARESQRLHVDATERFFASLPDDFVEDLFATKVKDVDGLTVDGESKTTGAALLEVADETLTIFTMQSVLHFCRLSEAEKNDSSSPSTSAQEVETVDGRSTAEPAARGDGQLLETAMEPPSAAT